MLRVSTPVPGYSGSVGGVHFANGEAMVDGEVHAAEVDYFRRSGYVVDEGPVADATAVDAEPEAGSDVDGGDGDESEPQPAKNASTETWRTWAVDHGGMPADEAGALSRDELVARFAENEENS
jgi:hypothetical protein